MATIRKEILIDTTAEKAWDALRDVGALHTRLVAGFVTDTKLEGNARVVTFATLHVDSTYWNTSLGIPHAISSTALPDRGRVRAPWLHFSRCHR